MQCSWPIANKHTLVAEDKRLLRNFLIPPELVIWWRRYATGEEEPCCKRKAPSPPVPGSPSASYFVVLVGVNACPLRSWTCVSPSRTGEEEPCCKRKAPSPPVPGSRSTSYFVVLVGVNPYPLRSWTCVSTSVSIVDLTLSLVDLKPCAKEGTDSSVRY